MADVQASQSQRSAGGSAVGSAGRRTAGARQSGRVSVDRLLAVTLILLELSVLGYLSEARLFPVFAAGWALWGLGTRLRLAIEPSARNLVCALLAIVFLLHYMFAPFPLPLESQFIRSSLAHSIARLLICIQILQLFLQHPRGLLPIWIAGCGAVALCFATNLRVPGDMHRYLVIVVGLFVGAFALYGAMARRVVGSASSGNGVRLTVMISALLLALGLGASTSWALQKHERAIEWFLSDYLGYGARSARTGFSPAGRLQSVTSWKTDGGERVMLRVFSKSAPGHLRGKAFDVYQGANRETSYTAWVSSFPSRPARTTTGNRSLPRLRPGDQLFEIAPAARPPWRTLDVWPEEQTEARLFTPLEARLVALSEEEVRLDGHGIVTLPDRVRALPYLILAEAGDPPAGQRPERSLSPEERQQLTALSGPVDPEVRALAHELFQDCHSTRDKLDAVQEYFRANYRYQMGLNVPHRMDPITYFLIEQPAAHCEYFATGTAVLLRLADVPCRYVVGYVAGEWNRIGGFWVARNKDAHAWVEAYDDDTGEWLTVESTPAAGVPQPHEKHFASQLADSFRHRLSILRMGLQEYGVISLLSALGAVVWSIPGLILLSGVVLAMLARYRPALSIRRRPPPPPSHLKELHQVLARLDRQVRASGFERQPGETLSQFSTRVRASAEAGPWKVAMADCYELYVGLRYRGQTGPEALAQLQQAVSRIPRFEASVEHGQSVALR